MSRPTATNQVARERQFVIGPEKARITILTPGAETDGRHDLMDTVLPAGSMTPLHLHTRYEERVYVISGSLTVWIGPDRLTVGAGGFYRIPLNVPTPSRPARTPTPSSSARRPGSPSWSPAPAPPPTSSPRRRSPTSTCSRP
jgi:uncharacterized RmlC-like cupin family protein